MKKLIGLIIFNTLLFNMLSNAEITLPSVLSDNMVLQRDIPVNIWGWAKPGESIAVSFSDQKINGKADKNGKWKVQLKPVKAGGPYELKVKGKNEIVLKNILVGDVWICSGQSNMEFQLNKSKNAAKEVKEANYSSVRLFNIGHTMGEKPLEDIRNAKWEECSSQTAANFSAIGYFFGRNLHQHLNVPIGLINTSWGGTNIEAWTSMETMYTLPEYKTALDSLKTKDFSKNTEDPAKLREIWDKSIATKDLGIVENWQNPSKDYSKWQSMKIPQLWEGAGLPNLDGSVWFQTEFELSAMEAKNDITVSPGRIDDNDQTFVNGHLVGETNDYALLRNYKVPAKYLKEGKNCLVVRAIDYGWGGGLYSTPEELYVETSNGKTSLAGNWKFKVGLDLPSPYLTQNPNEFPSSLFNAMINPFINFGIKGAIWYQGEANVKAADKYRILMPNLISDWRKKWNQGDFTFLMVQLANFDCSATNDDGDWPALRESQAITATTVTKTGMAVTIDIGESHDIHPTNKQDVGLRLALAAQKIAYNENIISSGPSYKSMKVEGDKIIVEFDNIGSGLYTKDKYGYVRGFEIAGADKKFVYAKAEITSDNKVVVSNSLVKSPISVRYAWANDPVDVNLYNKEMLPAIPFRSE